MSLVELLVRQARRTPGRGALYNGQSLHATYGQWAVRSAAIAEQLPCSGLAPGDRVMAGYWGKRYVFVNDLPRNNYGKVLKTELRQRLVSGLEKTS